VSSRLSRKDARIHHQFRRYKENPDKKKTIMSMGSHRQKKEVQKLTGRIAGLNRFISKLGEHSLPFFKALRGGDKIEWGLE
jgi:hypothetical protein